MGFDGINVDIVGVVVVYFAQPTAHNAVFGCFTVEVNFDDDVEFDVFFVESLPECLCLPDYGGNRQAASRF